MKKFIFFIIFIHSLSFSNIIDDNHFYKLSYKTKIENNIKSIENKNNIKINLILINSEILLSDKSFANSKNSVFIVLTHDNELIQKTTIYTSPNVTIGKKDLNKINFLLKENLVFNKRFLDLKHETSNSIIFSNFSSNIKLKQLQYTLKLIDLTKNFSIKNSDFVLVFLKRNPLFFKLLIGFLAVLLIKIAFISFSKKE